jgi:hypothetical protein
MGATQRAWQALATTGGADGGASDVAQLSAVLDADAIAPLRQLPRAQNLRRGL